MLEMPALIQEWKQVSGVGFGGWERGADSCAEGTWARVEEIPLREGEEIGFVSWGVERWWVWSVTWVEDLAAGVWFTCTKALVWSCGIELYALYNTRNFVTHTIPAEIIGRGNADMQLKADLEWGSDLAENGVSE